MGAGRELADGTLREFRLKRCESFRVNCLWGGVDKGVLAVRFGV